MTSNVVNSNVVPTAPQVVYSQPNGQTTQYAPQTVPIPSSNGVNIVVYNPQVTPNANVSNVHNYPNQAYPQNYYTMPQVQQQETPIAATKLEETQKTTPQTPQNNNKTKEVVLLTDDYLKTLETYLDNQDPKVRILGVKELLNRFKEDDTRKADIGLTALLNKALQDPKDAIRFTAMSILNSGYATGDELTNKLLNNMQAGNGAYGDDSLVASEVLLKNAGKKVNIPDKTPDTPKQGVKS